MTVRIGAGGCVGELAALFPIAQGSDGDAVIRENVSCVRLGDFRNGTLGDVVGHIEDSVIDRFNRGVHHATVKATVRRNGEWYNFSYGHHLSSGARQITVSTLAGC